MNLFRGIDKAKETKSPRRHEICDLWECHVLNWLLLDVGCLLFLVVDLVDLDFSTKSVVVVVVFVVRKGY